LRYAVPRDFVEDLKIRVRAAEEAMQQRSVARSQHRSSTSRMAVLLKEGTQAVQELDVIFASVFRNDPVQMTVWKSVRRVKGLPQRKKAAAAKA
jgi:hypothetical protein